MEFDDNVQKIRFLVDIESPAAMDGLDKTKGFNPFLLKKTFFRVFNFKYTNLWLSWKN